MTRDRDPIANQRQATTAARLPALVIPKRPDDFAGFVRWATAVTERLQTREGERRNPLDAAVTKRELQAAMGVREVIVTSGKAGAGVMMQSPSGDWVRVSVDEFADLIRNTRLYSDLAKRIDDPTRFDRLSKEVRDILLPDLNELARQRGADIRQVDTKLQSVDESLAARTTELTAAIGKASSGIRQAMITQAAQGNASAVYALQITSRLDTFGGGTATIEEVYSTTADAISGLNAQYTLKANAGGAMAAIGLAATSSTAGVGDSAIILQAGKLAFVADTDVVGTGPGEVDPTSPDLSLIPFGVDGSGVFINGTVRINAGGSKPTLSSLAAATGIYVTYSSEFWKVDSAGTAVNTSITLTANLTAGLTGTVTWSKSGAGTTPPAAGTSNTYTINAADQTDDTCTYTATLVDSGITYTDSVTIARLRDGSNALVGMLTNESHTVPSDNAGVVSDYTGAGGTFKVYRGTTDITTSCAFSIVDNPSTLTASIGAATGVYSVTASGSWASGSRTTTITFRATIGGSTIDKTFTLTKANTGAAGSNGTNGTNAKLLALIASSQVFQIAKDGSVTPSSIAFSLNAQNLSGSPSFSVVSGTATLTGSGSTRSLASGGLTSDTATIQVTQDGLTDTITVAKVREGANAVVGYLTNEAHNVPANSGGPVTSYTGAGGTFKVFDGTTDVTSSCTFAVASNPDSVTTTINASGVYAVTASGSWANSSRVTTVTYTATYGTVVITKTFTITKSLQGAVGAAGTNTALIYLYQRATSAPAVPSATVTYTFATNAVTGVNNGWSTTVPSGSDPCYVTVATASGTGTTDTIATGEWASPVILAQDGAHGLNAATVYLFQRTSGDTPSLPSADITYTFATGAASGITNGWSQSMPASGGSSRWVTTATAVSNGATDTIASGEWAAAALLAQDGANGANGANGTNGTRGSLTVYASTQYGMTASSWPDADPYAGGSTDQLANRAISNAFNGAALTTGLNFVGHLVIGDTVTIMDTTSPTTASLAITKYWSGTGWIKPGVVIDGNLLVSGTVSANKVNGGTLTGVNFKAGPSGAPLIDVNGTTGAAIFWDPLLSNATFSNGFDPTRAPIEATAVNAAPGAKFTANTGTGLEVVGGSGGAAVKITKNSSQPAIWIGSIAADIQIGGSAGVAVTAGTGSSGDVTTQAKVKGGGSTNTDAAVIGRGTGILHGGRFHHGTTGNAGFIASGSASFVYDFYADGSGTNYGPFTGAHDALIPKDAAATPGPGDILVDASCLRRANVSNTIFEVALSSAANQAAVIGVAVTEPREWDAQHSPAALKTWVEIDGEMVQLVTADAIRLSGTHDALCVNALGEGQINVCGEGGDIAAGDFIVTSSIPGKGMRQAPAVITMADGTSVQVQVHCNFTVAKAREAVTFSDPSEVKMIACTYHCG